MSQIAILDYGGQYVQNIRRAFREMSLEAEIVTHASTMAQLGDCAGIVLSGGPYSVYRQGAPSVDRSILGSGKPILGLCYGHQLMAHSLGGEVAGGETGEYGFAEINILHDDPLFKAIETPQIAWMSHGDAVVRLPKDFLALASTRDCANAAMVHKDLPLYGLQFHPEVSHTPKGWQILENFARDICRLAVGSWDPQAYIRSKVEQIRREVGDGTAMVAASGGVDSTVAAVLAQRALGTRLVAVHVDHGFMRQGESKRVIEELQSLGLETVLVDASERFLDALSGLTDGDAKRRKIGELFIRSFEEIAVARNVTALIQGTIAPDAIESSRGMASKGKGSAHGGSIKLHHNVGGLPEEMWIRVIEPIRDLFKYQVRVLGRALGVADHLLERQPFPGPGLSVRIAGAADRDDLESLRRATSLAERVLEAHKPAQYLVYFISRRSEGCREAGEIAREILGADFEIDASIHRDVAVGVKGDERTLGRIVSLRVEDLLGEPAWGAVSWLEMLRLQSAITGRMKPVCRVLAALGEGGKGSLGAVIRAVDTRDFMTAMPSRIPFEELLEVGRQLGEIPGVGAYFYEITTKPSSTIELE